MRGLSQRRVASDLKISQALLSHYENGLREPRLEFLVTLSEYFHVSTDFLLGLTPQGGTGEPTPAQQCAAEYLCLRTMELELGRDDPRRELIGAAALLAEREYRSLSPQGDAAQSGALLLAHSPQSVREGALRRITRLESEDR